MKFFIGSDDALSRKTGIGTRMSKGQARPVRTGGFGQIDEPGYRQNNNTPRFAVVRNSRTVATSSPG